MELTKTAEVILDQATINSEPDMRVLSDLQLALVGGGIGEVIVG